MAKVDRRRFLGGLGTGGLALAGATRLARSWHGSADAQVEGEPVRQAGHALGTTVTVMVLHPRPEVARRAVDLALAEVQRVDRMLSLYRPDSVLVRLNERGVLRHPPPELVAVLQMSAAVSQQTGGAFDITVQPLWELYAQAERAGTVPEGHAVRAAWSRVDWRRVHIRPHQIELFGAGTQITLNGIAQGFAADRALGVLRAFGIEHALVDTGELAALGGKTPHAPWIVGIRHPRRANGFCARVQLAERCLATSGDYATQFRYAGGHHIFDPRTGRSPDRLASVTVVAPTACQADALATALVVLSPEEGTRLVRATPGVDALWVFPDGHMVATEGFPWEV